MAFNSPVEALQDCLIISANRTLPYLIKHYYNIQYVSPKIAGKIQSFVQGPKTFFLYCVISKMAFLSATIKRDKTIETKKSVHPSCGRSLLFDRWLSLHDI